MGDLLLAVPADGDGARSIAPTDVAQYIRLDQCERFLRLRLHEHATSRDFMRGFGVSPQSIPPLLTASGAAFEEQVEAAIARRYPVLDLGQQSTRPPENGRVLAAMRQLPPGETLILLQPRLEVVVAGWRLRGDVDLLRLERDGDGALALLIADMKSSTAARVEHRLQVAIYHEMLATLLDEARVEHRPIELGILYRGSEVRPADETDEQREQRRLAAERFNVDDAFLELVARPEEYRAAVRDLVTGPDSAARRAALSDFLAIPFHLAYKCDGCLYNEFCMKWCAEHDDLSLLPHLSAQDKRALEVAGVATTRRLAELKLPSAGDGSSDLSVAPGSEELVKRLGATWPVGPRLDELIYRARRYQGFHQSGYEAPPDIPSKGYGSLPYSDDQQNPNLLTVYLDAQHDYLNDRVYLAGALVVARRGGKPARRRSIVRLASRPVDDGDGERDLLVGWVRDTLRAIVELAEPDEAGGPNAPIHLVVFNRFGRDLLLEALARHFETVLGLTPLYDFMTQLAAFDSPVLTFLEEEIRELKNYPMVCQSLQSVATFLKFDWSRPHPLRRVFRERVFDYVGKLGGDDGEWYTRRSRFNSQIPLEYAYAAWGELPAPTLGERDDYAAYRPVTPELLHAFEARRLEALEHIAGDFRGNKQTQKSSFRLPDLNRFTEKARNLAQALDEFVIIERHASLAAWKAARLAPPERRVLSGDTLLVRFQPEEQDVDARVRNRQNRERWGKAQQLSREYLAAHPDEDRAQLSKEQKAETRWAQDGLRFKLALTVEGCDCDLDEALALSTLREGDHVVVSPRWDRDSRLPEDEQYPYTPTPKAMLYKARGEIERIVVRRDADGRAVAGQVELVMSPFMPSLGGFTFAPFAAEPFADGELYTLDEDPNNIYGYWCSRVTAALCRQPDSPLYQRLAGQSPVADWPEAAAAGQARFFAGLEALQRAGFFDEFEPSKREFIAAHGGDATLLVQGPPGTGKSFGTAYALLARIQGAMAAGRDYRVVVSCKTHAATDVLIRQFVRALEGLRLAGIRNDEIFRRFFDDRLLELPLYRFDPRGDAPEGVKAVRKPRPKSGELKHVDVVIQRPWCVVAATPGGVYRSVTEKWDKDLLGHELCDCLVLDEASQLSLPEAVMAGLLLRSDAPVIVVGDHRQMPPIVQHDWEREARRTFKEFRTFESLFSALLAARPPTVRFAESFRLHAAMAEFLRREVYAQDGIRYFSRKHDELPPVPIDDEFVAAVLRPQHPLVVVVHDEAGSQVRNQYEQELIAPILEALADPQRFNLDAEHGLGVVVPHRAQRAALTEAVPALSRVDPATGEAALSAVDTVERFQGGERDVIVVSATESDREYLLVSGEFLLDPRRLTVALSRAKHKMILVASRSIFQLFSADEETFAHAQLWKNLLRETCTVPLWQGARAGHHVEVWGNVE